MYFQNSCIVQVSWKQGVNSELCSLQMEPITARLISYSLAHCLHMYTLPAAHLAPCIVVIRAISLATLFLGPLVEKYNIFISGPKYYLNTFLITTGL